MSVPFRKNTEPTEEFRVKLPIGLAARLHAHLEGTGSRNHGQTIAPVLDQWLKGLGK